MTSAGQGETLDHSNNVTRVLLIEDNELDVEAVLRCFRRDQLVQVSGRIEITAANCLKDAFELISNNEFQAILLDLGLPEGVGIEVLHKVRALSLQIPIIILTGNEDDALGVEALRSGADDYLKKSAVTPDTLPRSVRYSIERNYRMRAESQLQRTQAEILAAETIQQKLIPDYSPEIEGFDIFGACLPAEKIGGDLFDYLDFDANSCTGVIADVSGHGLPAAILMTELHGLLHGLVEQNVSLPRLMSAANYRTDRATEAHQFITMISYFLSAENHSLSYISAGHPAWLLKSNGEQIVLESQYLPLGVDAQKRELSLANIKIGHGDIIVLPTDGIFESLGEHRERFGVQRMLDEIWERRQLSAKQIVLELLENAKQFSLNHQLVDDCTLVLIKVETET